MNLAVLERMVSDGDLSIDALQYLLNCKSECQWLDYKESLSLEYDKGVADFARDILAMKNVGGGYLLVGVKDKTWEAVGLTGPLPYDAKLLRDKVRKCTGLELEVVIVHHALRLSGRDRLFALIFVRASKRRQKRRVPSIVHVDFKPNEPFGLRRGDIYIRKVDSTVRIDSEQSLQEVLDDLEETTDRDALEVAGSATPFAVEDGTYRLLEKGFDTFIGRAALRDEILASIDRDPRIWIINVHGPGGVGKSALVNWVVYKCYEERQFEGILHLTGKDTVLTAEGIRKYGRSLYSLDDLLDQILITYKESTELSTAEKHALAIDLLSAWKTLLVLDNMETVTDGRILAFIQKLPPTCQSKVLMTSRTKTGGWELPIPVTELSLPEVEEFVKVKCAEFGIAYPFISNDYSQILDATGGLPLAIQWLLGRLKVENRLNNVLGQVGRADSPVLEFSFRNIWNILSPDAKAVLCLCTIFDAPPSMQNLAIASEWATDRIERALEQLTELTLTTRTVRLADGQVVFACLPITLSFARHQFGAMGEFETQCRRRVNRFNDQVSLQQSELHRFTSTFERYGIASDSEKRAAILCSRGQSEMFAGNTDRADGFFLQAREMAPNSSYVFAMSASYELARNRVGMAMDIARKACSLSTKRNGALAYSVLARVHDVQRDRRGRVEALRKAVECDPSDVITRHQLGVALSRAGDTREAIEVFSQIVDEEKQKSPPTETLLMALKTRVINLKRLGRDLEASQDIKYANDVISANPHLRTHAAHILELVDE